MGRKTLQCSTQIVCIQAAVVPVSLFSSPRRPVKLPPSDDHAKGALDCGVRSAIQGAVVPAVVAHPSAMQHRPASGCRRAKVVYCGYPLHHYGHALETAEWVARGRVVEAPRESQVRGEGRQSAPGREGERKLR